jgi:predicted small lipoprotein YifL
MKKSKVLFAILAIIAVISLVAGCGSSDKPKDQPPAANQEQAAGHQGHSAAMPKEDPMPMMKDLDKSLQDVVKQAKAGQTMDVQKSAAQLVSTVEKIVPHMMDANLKDSLRKAAGDIKNTVNSGKMDPSIIEGKVKTMQEIMKSTTSHLQTMQH